MLKRITWKENEIFSVKLRDDLFFLAQMRVNHLLEFFNKFNDNGSWDNVDLNTEQPLFCVFVAENKLKGLLVEQIVPGKVIARRLLPPKLMLSALIDSDNHYGASLIELDDQFSTSRKKTIQERLSVTDDLDKIYKYELCGMIGDPQKIATRLVNFYEKNINWDSSKSFIFKGIQLPG